MEKSIAVYIVLLIALTLFCHILLYD